MWERPKSFREERCSRNSGKVPGREGGARCRSCRCSTLTLRLSTRKTIACASRVVLEVVAPSQLCDRVFSLGSTRTTSRCCCSFVSTSLCLQPRASADVAFRPFLATSVQLARRQELWGDVVILLNFPQLTFAGKQVPVFPSGTSPPKFNESEERMKIVAGDGKKAKFWEVQGRRVLRRVGRKRPTLANPFLAILIWPIWATPILANPIPRRVGPWKGWGSEPRKMGARRGEGAQIFAFFSHLHHISHSLFLLLGVFSWNLGCVFKAQVKVSAKKGGRLLHQVPNTPFPCDPHRRAVEFFCTPGFGDFQI